MRFNRSIRCLHLAIMCSILIQLISELLMKVPKPGESLSPVEGFFLGLHEWNGFITLAIVIFYVMQLGDGGSDLKRLFPWTSISGCKGLWREIRFDIPNWLRGRLKRPAEAHYIAGTVHGLGILLAVALGATGIMIFMGLVASGNMNEDIKLLRELHSDLGELMWIYLFGHAGMALIHQFAGHRILQDMFSLKADEADEA